MKQMIKKFKDEKDFTINAVMPWLRSRKDYGDLEYTGGSEEYGRDVVFSKTEIGNRKVWWAVQVKDDDIKGTHKGNSNIQEIINQLKSAMSTPYTRKGETSKLTIQGLIVITLGNITKNASEIIKNSDDLKGRSIIFYNYQDILNELKEVPLNVTQVKFLIRLISKDIPKGIIEKLRKDYGFDIYQYEPSEDMFESNQDSYVDLSLIKFFDEMKNFNWKNIEKLIKKYIKSISVRFYYSKIFSSKDLENIKKRLFENIKIDAYEDQLGPCFIYNCNNFTFIKEEWVENVNNMQILQKN